MIKYPTSDLDRFISEGYIHIDDHLPKKQAAYDVIIHTGSMSPRLIKSKKLFLHAQFPRMDWDYVIAWKPNIN